MNEQSASPLGPEDQALVDALRAYVTNVANRDQVLAKLAAVLVEEFEQKLIADGRPQRKLGHMKFAPLANEDIIWAAADAMNNLNAGLDALRAIWKQK